MSGGYLTPQPAQRNQYARLTNSNAASSLRSIPFTQPDLSRLASDDIPMTELVYNRRGSSSNGSVTRELGSRVPTPRQVSDTRYLQVPSHGYQNNGYHDDRLMTSSLSRSSHHSGSPSPSQYNGGSRRGSDFPQDTSFRDQPPPSSVVRSPPRLEIQADDMDPDYDDDPDDNLQTSDYPHSETDTHMPTVDTVPGSRRSSATVTSRRTEKTDLSAEERDSGAGSLGRSSDEYTSKKEETETLLGDKWDIFREHPVTTGTSCSDLGTKIIKVTKVLVTGLLVATVMGGAVLSKLNFFFITEQLGKLRAVGKQDDLWINHYGWLLCLALSLPDVLKVLQTSWRIAFGKREKPDRSIFIFICVTEVLHAAVLYGVTFKVFPFLTSSKSLTVTMATGAFPALLGTLVAVRKKEKVLLTARLLAFLLQGGAVALCCMYIIFAEVKVAGIQVKDTDVLEFRVWAVCGLVVLSLRWLKNYFPESFCKIKLDISSRTKGSNMASFVSSILRIITAAIMLKIYFVPELSNPIPAMRVPSSQIVQISIETPSIIEIPLSTIATYSTPSSTFSASSALSSMSSLTTSDNISVYTTPVLSNLTDSTLVNDTVTIAAINDTVTTAATSPAAAAAKTRFFVQSIIAVELLSALEPVIVHIGSTWFCFYFAITACKLCIQRLAFSLPLVLASPVLFILLQFAPDVGRLFVWGGSHDVHLQIPDVSTEYWLLIGAFVLGWVSQVLMCAHVWKVVPIKRLAFTPQLFIMPHYCGALADLSLLHSRRQMEDVSEQPNKENSHPMIYICATMWHENEQEMMQILTSLFRLDDDQCAKQLAKQELKAHNVDYYEFEVHILFDDAMCDETEEGPDNKRIKTGRRAPNDYVKTLSRLLDEAASEFLDRPVKLSKAVKYKTPYGARVVWTFPGQNKFIVHLKDKDKIRHRKRWSQVMYMYYLLGYKLAGADDNQLDMNKISTAEEFLHELPPSIVKKADNTYILALDGDVDFKPEAVHLLVDRMKKNPDVAAACGRIRPKGSGPVIWYQKFEYAIGHWLQKSAEHVFGCVLCSPGCFSLFRGRCLMDDNVMKTYTKKPVTARHHLQYDQGEDRWLCTLLLQQGYRVEYCAASEALTFAPEGFNEFFNQRRRWLPSTMANVLDLLMSRSTTVVKNKSISNLYIFYQTVLFVSSVLGPATVLLAIESSVETVFGIPGWAAYLIVYLPNIIFSFACLRFKAETQLTIAIVLSTTFALIMMAVIAGTMVNIAQEGWLTPNAIFMYVLVGSFVVSGIMHPHEFSDLVWGVLYFLCIPAGYLFLIIYSICNLNIISWGTREGKTVNEQQEEHTVKTDTQDQAVVYLGEAAKHLRNQIKQDGDDSGCCNCVTALFRRMRSQLTANATLLFILEALTRMERGNSVEAPNGDSSTARQRRISQHNQITAISETTSVESGDTDPTSDWILTDEYIEGDLKTMNRKEEAFWKRFINKYLEPIDKNPAYEAKIKEDMLELRNKSAFAFFFLNGLWLVIMTALQEVKRELNITIYQPDGPPIIVHPLGLVFLAVFSVLLVLQILAMMKHRYGTFLHVLAFTPIMTPSKSKDESSIHLASVMQKPVDNLQIPEDFSNEDTLQEYSDTFHSSPGHLITGSRRRNFHKSAQDPSSFMLHRYIQNTSRTRGRYRRDLPVSRDQREVVDYHKTFNRVYSTIKGASRTRMSAANIF